MPATPLTANHPKDWRRGLATAIWSGLTLIAVVLISRKFAGAMTGQVSAATACLVASVTALLSLLAHWLFHGVRRADAQKKVEQIAAGVITLLPPFALGVLLLPDHSTVAVSYLTALFLFAGTAVLVLGDSTVRAEEFDRQWDLAGGPLQSGHPDMMPAGMNPHPEAIETPAADLADAAIWPPPHQDARHVSQWMTRTETDEGQECIEGSVKIHFAAGQKQAIIHLPFCPPLFEQPVVECEVLDGADIRFKVAAHPYGARIEARRAGSRETAETVEVGFAAVAPIAKNDAA